MRFAPAVARQYWETIRHLRPIQLYGRLWFRVPRQPPRPRAPPPLRAWDPSAWAAPASKGQSLFGPDEFRLLNETHLLSNTGWDDPVLARLWRYNLHYFDDLNAAGCGSRRAWHEALIANWIAGNPPGRGTGWEPYPTSLRVVNWIKWSRAGNALPAAAIDSMAAQVRWLRGRLEHHLQGNHLLANAKALVFAGCFFDGDEADRWLGTGLRILARQLPEQIVPDGGHFELSPMYHAIALDDVLDLLNVVRSSAVSALAKNPVADWCMRARAMCTWLSVMCHPDGEIAFFNDAAFSVAPSPAELAAYAQRLGLKPSSGSPNGCTWLRDSGYIRLENRSAVALLDVAKVGPDHLPGHGHADTLSFELSVAGRRVLVNSGTSLYGLDAERLRQRGTAAHNTVAVDGADSSEVWSGFRVARRARPVQLAVGEDAHGWIVSCAHDGYLRLHGRPLHRRSWHFRAGGLAVADRVEGPHGSARAFFHIHPDLEPSSEQDGRSGMLSSGGKPLLRWLVRKGTPRLGSANWHPEFGVSLPATVLEVQLSHGESEVDFLWG